MNPMDGMDQQDREAVMAVATTLMAAGLALFLLVRVGKFRFVASAG